MIEIDFDKFLTFLEAKGLKIEKKSAYRFDLSDKENRCYSIFKGTVGIFDYEYSNVIDTIKRLFALNFTTTEFVDFCKK